MSKFDFSDLFAKYPAIISAMPDEFTSHEFILNLARENQTEYVNALFAYRNVSREGKPTPFMFVHGELSRGLRKYPELVEKIADVSSVDIFGQPNGCSLWRKLK
ncbi:MAG TPA: hypothetical protein ENF22_09370 [Chloroflexi bacterium]|nr:hypothetical protein [Chloroflexota bacterium]